MRRDKTGAARPLRRRRSRSLLIALAVALGTGLISAAPAHADATFKYPTVGPSGEQGLRFVGSDTSRSVDGVVELTVLENGNWNLSGNASNKNQIGRWYPGLIAFSDVEMVGASGQVTG